MMFWTWQSADFDPFKDQIDRARSAFFNNPPHADLLQAYDELDTLLALSDDMKHQYVWCFASDSWSNHP